MKRLALYLIVFSIALNSCNRYPESDFNIDQKARNYLAFYKPNDIWVFENSQSKIDTILITTIDSTTHIPPLINFLGYGPRRTINIGFRQLLKDDYYKNNDSNMGVGINIVKEPNHNREDIRIAFFHSFGSSGYQDSMGVTKFDSLIIDNILFTNYIDLYSDIDHIRWHKATNDSLDIMHIYWVNKYGIIAYKYRNGDIWKRINLK